MVKILTVFGATGIQGGSVVDAVLKSQGYTLRAVTRNPNSESSKRLASRGIEVVQADLDDTNSIRSAIAGSHAVFGVTNFFETFIAEGAERAMAVEVEQGTKLAQAVASTMAVAHFIWSTLPPTEKISNGGIAVPHYESKSRVQEYIESLPELRSKTTFMWIPWYDSNILYPFYSPVPLPTAGPDTYVQIMGSPASTKIKVAGDVRTNVGLFVQAILDQPDKTLPGRMVLAQTEELSAGDLLLLWGRVHGKDVHYIQVVKHIYYSIWPKWGKIMDESHIFWGDFEKELRSYERDVLTKEDLDISGLVGIEAAWAKMVV